MPDRLDSRIVAATGESLPDIRRQGFSLADPNEIALLVLDDRPPLVIDWDSLDSYRVALFP